MVGATTATIALLDRVATGQMPGIGVRLIDVGQSHVNTTTDALDIARGLGVTQQPYTIQRDVTSIVPWLDMGDPGTFAANLAYPGGYGLPGDESDFVLLAQASLTIPAGRWQIAFGSDDGGTVSLPDINLYSEFGEGGPPDLMIAGDGWLLYEEQRGHLWTGATFDVSQPTSATLSGVFFERGGLNSFEIAIRDATSGSLNSVRPADGWTLLGDGALGWQVATDVSPGRRIGGQHFIGDETLIKTHLQGALEGNPTLQSGLFVDVYHGNFDSRADWDAVLAEQPFPLSQGVIPSINWAAQNSGVNGAGYPPAFGFAGTTNREYYSVRAQGEIFVSQNGTVRFRDANDDYAYLAIDLDGDGVIDQAMEVVIDDDRITGLTAQRNSIGGATFSNVAAGGEFRRFDFRMAEDAEFDSGVLYWDQNAGAPPFPPTSDFPSHPQHLVPPSAFRTTTTPILSGDLVVHVGLDLPLVFDIDVGLRTADQISMSANPDPARFRNVLNLDGAKLIVELLAGKLEPGDTFDLIDETHIDAVVGSPTFDFPFGNWDTSSFASNGQIVFLSGGIDPPVDEQASIWKEPVGGNWHAPANWSAGVPNAPGDFAVLGSGFPAPPALITLDAPTTVGAIEYDNSGSIRIAGSAGLTFAADSEGTPRIELSSTAGNLEIASPLDFAATPLSVRVSWPQSRLRLNGVLSSQSSDLVKEGPGRLVLGGDNADWQGALNIQGGVVQVVHGNALGTTATPTVLSHGALIVDASSAEPIEVVRGTVILNDAATPYAGTLTIHNGTLSSQAIGSVGLSGALELVDGGTVIIDALRQAEMTIRGGTRGTGSVHFASDGFVYVAESPLGHSGDVVIDMGEARTIFQAANTYTGVTWVNSGELWVEQVGGLGTTDVGTVINGGRLIVPGGDSEPVRVNEGILWLETSPDAPAYRGAIELAGGTLDTRSFFGGTVSVVEPVALLDGPASTIRTGSSDTLILDGGIVGSGHLMLAPNNRLDINGTIAFEGDITVSTRGVHLNGANEFAGRMILDNGLVNVNENYSVSELHFRHGGVQVAEGKTLRSDAVYLSDGSIQGAISGVDTLRKVGFSNVQLIDIGPEFDPAIQIAQGMVTVSGASGLGQTGRGTEVTSERNAVLRIGLGVTARDDIFLNNASGFGYGGAIVLDDESNPSEFATLSGAVHLGERGSVIGVLGASTFTLEMDGPISGGALTVNATGGVVQLGTNDHTYSGKTHIFAGQLLLNQEGQLFNTPEVMIDRGNLRFGELRLESSSVGTHGDRIADDLAVVMRGGMLTLQGRDDAQSTETIGTVLLENGESRINSTQDGFLQPSELVINRLERRPGATVRFNHNGDHDGFFLGEGIDSPQVHVRDVTLDDGIIGGWATARGFFVTVGDDGLRSLREYVTELAQTTPATNFRQAGVVILDSDTVLNSLLIESTDEFTLDGHTLTVHSGGILKSAEQGPSRLVGGRLTSGGPELFLHVQSDFEVSSDIVDNGEASVSLVKSGVRRLDLRGVNSYSGATIINDGEVVVYSVDALPTSTALEVNGGRIYFSIDEPNEMHLPSVSLRHAGVIAHNVGVLRLSADTIAIESGTLALPLYGSGTMRKTSLGIAHVLGDNSDFQGDVEVVEGVLSVEHVHGLGSGNHIVRGGVLALGSEQVIGDVALDGGVLSLGEATHTTLTGDILVTSDSAIDLANGLFTRGFGARPFTLQGRVTVSESQELRINGLEFHPFRATGGITLEAGARLTGSADIEAAINLADGAAVQPGSSPGAMSISTMSWSSGGVYVWEVNDAEGTEGAPVGAGWDRLTVDALSIDAVASTPFILQLVGLDRENESGRVHNFDPTRHYDWRIVDANNLLGFDASHVAIDPLPFLEQNPISPLGFFELSQVETDLILSYRLRELPGDYNGSGQVEQGDLDLVLLNWGGDGSMLPNGWVNDLPSGLVDQDELDGVLLNWGNTTMTGVANAAVPEPTACALLITIAIVAGALVRSAKGPVIPE